MDKDLRRKILSRAVDIAIEISSKEETPYERCTVRGMEKACSEFEVSVSEFAKSFL